MSDSFPVFVEAGGARVRVGTAFRAGDGFVLRLEGMSIEGTPVAATGPSGSGLASAVFPPYGRSKGKPVSGATTEDLEYYAAGCRRTLEDANKARWHDKERVLLAAIEAELSRQGGAATEPGAPSLADDDIPF